MTAVTIETIDACLPQTQCTRCGYPRCRDYAQAIAEGKSDFNRCPPGDETTLNALSKLLGRPSIPLDPDCGLPAPRRRAVIDEDICIGCRKCIEACPVDAIVGARKLMHTVIVADCTGCELCLPPCPVDCINLVRAQLVTGEAVNTPSLAHGPRLDPIGARWPEYREHEVSRWRLLAERHFTRLEHRRRKRAKTVGISIFPDREIIRAEIQAAKARRRPGR